jgi:hypothetical protein
MLARNIEAEYDRHIFRLKNRVFEEFTLRTDEEIARQSKAGVLLRKMENPINRADVFFDLIESQYNALLREAVDAIKVLFDRHGIGFRLIDIHECMHGYHRITMMWAANRREYVFDCLFDSSQDNAFESFYRLGEIDSCGTAINGDILNQDTRQFIEDAADLPTWFVSGLQRNS